MNAGGAQWVLAGQVVVAWFARSAPVAPATVPGQRSLPGPGLVIAAHYQASPIGPFTELAVLEPSHRGWVRVGLTVTRSVVDDERARRAGRSDWGLPRELGALRWESDDGRIRLSWEEEEFALEAVTGRVALPVALPLHLFQQRAAESVVVPIRLRGMAHRARVRVEAGEDSSMRAVAGEHGGAVVRAPRLRIDPAAMPIEWGNLARLGRRAVPVARAFGPNG